MAKVTVRQSGDASDNAIERPSDMIVKQAAKQVVVTDDAGRSITLRTPRPLQRLRFIDAMGESSSNQLWAATVAPLMYVASIDGTLVPAPSTKAQIEALYQRLDDHGMDALAEGLKELFELDKAEVDEAAAKK